MGKSLGYSGALLSPSKWDLTGAGAMFVLRFYEKEMGESFHLFVLYYSWEIMASRLKGLDAPGPSNVVVCDRLTVASPPSQVWVLWEGGSPHHAHDCDTDNGS